MKIFKTIKFALKGLILLFIITVVFICVRKLMPYETEYYKFIGCDSEYNLVLGKEVIESIGEPNKIIKDEFGRGVFYFDGIVVTCRSISHLSLVTNVSIYSPKYRFGLYKIGVGSPKWLVDFAYKASNAKKSPEIENVFLDKYMSVEYSYDTSNHVEMIKISEYDWH